MFVPLSRKPLRDCATAIESAATASVTIVAVVAIKVAFIAKSSFRVDHHSHKEDANTTTVITARVGENSTKIARSIYNDEIVSCKHLVYIPLLLIVRLIFLIA